MRKNDIFKNFIENSFSSEQIETLLDSFRQFKEKNTVNLTLKAAIKSGYRIALYTDADIELKSEGTVEHSNLHLNLHRITKNQSFSVSLVLSSGETENYNYNIKYKSDTAKKNFRRK